MRHLSVVVFAAVSLSCSGMLVDDYAGQLQSDGSITPCGTFHVNPQACGNARWNGKVIGQVELGQTKDQVRAIMKHDPERREAEGSEERWAYLTDYDGDLMTVIVFREGRVVALRQAPWN
jgi:hypothetical protein